MAHGADQQCRPELLGATSDRKDRIPHSPNHSVHRVGCRGLADGVRCCSRVCADGIANVGGDLVSDLLPTSEPWMSDANCATSDPDLFTGEKGQPSEPAKKICGAGDVTAECLEYAIRTMQTRSIWGGKTTRERIGLRRKAA